MEAKKLSNKTEPEKSVLRLSGFTLVEMMIVAPIVILVIGIFVTAVITMTGRVLTTRGSNFLALSINDTITKINQDVENSTRFLATNSFSLTSPQGYNDVTAAFHNADATQGNLLILESNATTKNPLDPSSGFVYTANSPYTCADPLLSRNTIVKINIVYFTKNNSLWRRVILPSNYTTVGCSLPWQIPSCTPGNVAGFCKTQDMDLIDGISVSGFTLSYYAPLDTVNPIANATNSGLSDVNRQTALDTAATVRASITGVKTIAGNNVTQSSTTLATRIKATY